LPNQGNQLSEDLPRLRESFVALDAKAQAADQQTAENDAAQTAARPVAATQGEVNTGNNSVKYVTPNTLKHTTFNASRISGGTLDISLIPAAALEDLITVQNDAALYALTAADVHVGVSVRVLEDNEGQAYDPPRLYIIHDMGNLDNEAGYREYSIVVRWEDIKSKPLGETPARGNLVVYGEGGTVPVSAPVAAGDAASKGYVDTAFLDYFLGWHIFKGIHPAARPGMVPVTGTLIANAATLYPKAWAYLQSADGQLLCTTETLWQAASVAKWATLADDTQIGWDGIGGVCKYVIDTDAGTIRVPDLRGMYEEVAGFDSLGVGMVHGDAIRNITGGLRPWHVQLISWRGAFVSGEDSTSNRPGGADANLLTPWIIFDPSRVVPTANKNQPRAWGALACVYLGLPAS
jgi:hypothetical protein